MENTHNREAAPALARAAGSTPRRITIVLAGSQLTLQDLPELARRQDLRRVRGFEVRQESPSPYRLLAASFVTVGVLLFDG